jgi:sulfoacetaldehyde acetyltransferase
MHPRQMLRELEKAMPEHAMVSTDIGNICQVANSYLKFNEPRLDVRAMMFGNCGYAFPTMIGCKLAAPDGRHSRTSATARGASRSTSC